MITGYVLIAIIVVFTCEWIDPLPLLDDHSHHNLIVVSDRLLAVITGEWIDRSLITVAMESIRVDLGLTDTQLGAVAASSYWVATVSVLPIGRLADKWSRRDVIAVALCVWAGGTVLSGFCTTFTTLCIARGFVGLGTAGFYPVSESMVGDFFEPEVGFALKLMDFVLKMMNTVFKMMGFALNMMNLGKERGTAFGWFGFAWMFGYLLGMVCGGWMVEKTSWQTTFIVMGAPQVPTATADLGHSFLPLISIEMAAFSIENSTEKRTFQ